MSRVLRPQHQDRQCATDTDRLALTDGPGNNCGDWSSRMSDDTYEMFWDCKYCRTPKLLGLTHRHCPVCGAPQNAAERYFPSDAEKVRVADHRYVGRDVVCQHCGTYNSRSSKHCRDCGGPTEEGADAPVRRDRSESAARPAGQALAAASPARGAVGSRRRSPRVLLFGLIGLVIVAALGALVFAFWKKEQNFEVAGHAWERRIEIERFGPVRHSAWCDQLPSGAREVSRQREVRTREQVPDGETCTTRKVDQGDGTFREVKDCKPRYKTREIKDYRCDYEVNRWATARFVEAKGQGTTPAPTWPQLPSLRTCGHVGCERVGAKRETYRLLLAGPDGDASCEVDQSRWLKVTKGAQFRAKVRLIGGSVDCASASYP